MVNMDTLRKRYTEAKQADEARNTLLDDLLQKVDDLQKTMDRNAFVMVLIDGDCMNVRVTLLCPNLEILRIVSILPYVSEPRTRLTVYQVPR